MAKQLKTWKQTSRQFPETYIVHLTLKSRNSKVGNLAVSTTEKKTCPDACPLLEACYAKHGPLGMFWQKVNGNGTGVDWNAFCHMVAAFQPGALWRHNQAGDLPGNRLNIDKPALRALVRANIGKRGFTFSHYDVIGNSGNRAAIRAANAAGFVINLSGNNPAHADALAETGAGPVVTVLPADCGRMADRKGNWKETETEYKARIGKLVTPAGRAIVPCPATYKDNVQCKNCGLCAVARKAIIGFPAHGVSTKKADTIARAA